MSFQRLSERVEGKSRPPQAAVFVFRWIVRMPEFFSDNRCYRRIFARQKFGEKSGYRRRLGFLPRVRLVTAETRSPDVLLCREAPPTLWNKAARHFSAQQAGDIKFTHRTRGVDGRWQKWQNVISHIQAYQETLSNGPTSRRKLFVWLNYSPGT